MNPSNLPPQGRYTDDRLQQMVLDELVRQGVTPEKFYFTSDDWMVSYDGPTPAWNSVFGVAAYHQNGQAQYAECGVSQRYDAAASQWGDPAATVKTGLPLSEEAFQAAPSGLPGGAAAETQGGTPDAGAPGANSQDAGAQDAGAQDAGGQDAGAQGAGGQAAQDAGGASAPDSSQTMMANAIPGLPGQGDAAGGGGAAVAGGAAAGVAGGAVAGAALAGSAADPDEEQSQVPSGEEWSAAERADGQPRVEPGPGHDWHHTDREPEPERPPVPSGDEWSSAEPATPPGGSEEPDVDADLRQAGDLGVDESAIAGTAAGGVAGAAGGAAIASAAGGSSDAAASAPEAPSYESAGAEAEAREHPDGGHHAHVAGYALRVKADGTAELQVPLGGQVTLRWADQRPD